jgi:hypothetical protein
LGKADLRLADLNEAKGVNNQELVQQAFSLEDAILPNGQHFLHEAAPVPQIAPGQQAAAQQAPGQHAAPSQQGPFGGSRPIEQRLVSVPDVTSLPVTVARETLEDNGLTLNNVYEESSNTIPEGFVISQSPQPGDLELPRSGVDVTIGEGS